MKLDELFVWTTDNVKQKKYLEWLQNKRSEKEIEHCAMMLQQRTGWPYYICLNQTSHSY